MKNQPDTWKNHKKQPGTMKNTPGILKTKIKHGTMKNQSAAVKSHEKKKQKKSNIIYLFL